MRYSYELECQVHEPPPEMGRYNKHWLKLNGGPYQAALIDKELHEPWTTDYPELRERLKQLGLEASQSNVRAGGEAYLTVSLMNERNRIKSMHPGGVVLYRTLNEILRGPAPFVVTDASEEVDGEKTGQAYLSLLENPSIPPIEIGSQFQGGIVQSLRKALLVQANPFTGEALTEDTPHYDKIRELDKEARREIACTRYQLGAALAWDETMGRETAASAGDSRSASRSFLDSLAFDPFIYCINPRFGRLSDDSLEREGTAHDRNKAQNRQEALRAQEIRRGLAIRDGLRPVRAPTQWVSMVGGDRREPSSPFDE